MEFCEGQIVTVFRSKLRPESADAYADHAAAISALARAMPGYVEHKIFTAEDGERVTLVTFADQETHDAWRDQADHRAAQRAGVADYYERYSIQIAAVQRTSSFDRQS